MHKAIASFNSSIVEIRNLTGLYDYLTSSVTSPFSFDDILRSQVVYSVSAFDKLMHDLIRIGMVSIFSGTRQPTPKFNAETISIEVHRLLVAASVPPKEIVFEQEIARKLRLLSFQEPKKIADGLSYIWDENQKWSKISVLMNLSEQNVKTTMSLIATRRNAIVHEFDTDIFTGLRTGISRKECNDITDFIEDCGNAIGKLVI